ASDVEEQPAELEVTVRWHTAADPAQKPIRFLRPAHNTSADQFAGTWELEQRATDVDHDREEQSRALTQPPLPRVEPSAEPPGNLGRRQDCNGTIVREILERAGQVLLSYYVFVRA